IAFMAVAIGAALHEAKQSAGARANAQKLRAQQAQFSRQITDLQADLASMTNRLDSLLAENARLKNNSNDGELLKLRGEVTRLRPLQDNVATLQKMLKQSSAGLAEWKTNELVDAGSASPVDALQTYLYLSQSDPAKIQNALVGDEVDPPDPEALQKFIKKKMDHPDAIGDIAGITGYKILSQSWLGPDKVQVELETVVKDKLGISAPMTLRKINGEWKLVVFNVRDQHGNVSELEFITTPP